MYAELILSSLVEISSYPQVFFYVRDLIILSISFVVENLSCIFGKGLLNMWHVMYWVTINSDINFIIIIVFNISINL
jgi:hypothetical protein